MYVTYCFSTWQSTTPVDKPLPPQQLHLDNLVGYVYDQAKKDAQSFAVISPAPHGLVNSKQCTPPHSTLPPEDLESLYELVKKQIKEEGVGSVDYWVVPTEYSIVSHPLHQYEMVLQNACEELGIGFNLKWVRVPLGSIKHEVPSPVSPANVEIGGPFSMNKITYVLRAQDEKGLWQDIRKSSFLPDLNIKAKSLLKKYPNQKVEIVSISKSLPI